jgi:glyoxylase-like metal-dependent hydrolase (beta-lactamase superfamily II)
MWKTLMVVVAVVALLPQVGACQDAKTVLEGVAKAMGGTDLKSIQYAGSGSSFAVGQNPNPTAPWPRFNAKSYTRSINYDTASMRDEIVRTQAEQPPRGGGGQPVIGENRQVQLVSGTYAWNQVGDTANPTLVAVTDRLQQLWTTPHGVIKAAVANNATVQSRTEGDKKQTIVAFAVPNRFKVSAVVNDRNLVEKVESWTTNPVLGDMLLETMYADYQNYNGVQFPTKITQKAGGFPALDLTVSTVQPNAAVDIQVPDNVRQAEVRVQSEQVADGVWYLAGGTHHSVLVEMKDYVMVVEGPQNDARALAVIAEVKKLVPNKPIKYAVNSHHHFDHAGGLGPFVAEGATIITHAVNKPFLEQALAAPRTVTPDKLAQSGKQATIEAFNDKQTLDDGTRTVELYLIKDNTHHDGLIMAYLPKEKLLIEADAYTPPAPNAPYPAQPNPFSVNLVENIERLKLPVEQILPLHGRVVPYAELLKAIGRSS